MEKKFECWNCGHHFVADDKEWVECPDCHSDNVEYATRKYAPWIRRGIVALIAVAAVAFGVKYYMDHRSTDTDISAVVEDKPEEEKKAVEEYVMDGNTIAPSFDLVKLEYDKDDGVYDCEFSVSPGAPAVENWELVIYELRTDKEVARSSDGKFSDVKPSENDGAYTLRIVDGTGKIIEETERDIMGFDKILRITTPMSAAAIEKILNSGETITDNPYIDHMNKVVVSNKPKGDDSNTATLTDVQRVLKSTRLKATVTKVEYNDLKQVEKVTLTINYPAGWGSDDEEDEEYY